MVAPGVGLGSFHLPALLSTRRDAAWGIYLQEATCPKAGVTSVPLCGPGEQGCQLPGTQSGDGSPVGSILSPFLSSQHMQGIA